MPSYKSERSEKADRGKAAEKDVQAFLEDYSARRADFDCERLPDARSSMGRIAAQVADFSFFATGVHGTIEVKTVAHDFRLARAKVTQLPKMMKRHLSGGRCFVLVFHSTANTWRKVPVQLLDPAAASWDLSAFEEHPTAAAALKGFADA